MSTSPGIVILRYVHMSEPEENFHEFPTNSNADETGETQLPPREPQRLTGSKAFTHHQLFLPGTQRLQWPSKQATVSMVIYSPTQAHLGSTPFLSSFRKHPSESEQSQGLVRPSWIIGRADENRNVPGVTDGCVPVWEQEGEQEREGQRLM